MDLGLGGTVPVKDGCKVRGLNGRNGLPPARRRGPQVRRGCGEAGRKSGVKDTFGVFWRC